jgi:hypothetical protein
VDLAGRDDAVALVDGFHAAGYHVVADGFVGRPAAVAASDIVPFTV